MRNYVKMTIDYCISEIKKTTMLEIFKTRPNPNISCYYVYNGDKK